MPVRTIWTSICLKRILLIFYMSPSNHYRIKYTSFYTSIHHAAINILYFIFFHIKLWNLPNFSQTWVYFPFKFDFLCRTVLFIHKKQKNDYKASNIIINAIFQRSKIGCFHWFWITYYLDKSITLIVYGVPLFISVIYDWPYSCLYLLLWLRSHLFSDQVFYFLSSFISLNKSCQNTQGQNV